MSDSKPKLNLQLMIDRIFRRKVFLDPQPDGSFKAITINGLENGYYKDEKGCTVIQPSRIREVSGLKNVRYICVKEHNTTELSDMFMGRQPILCPHCTEEIWAPAVDSQMSEKMFADIIDIAESAGRLQAMKEANPQAGSQMKLLMIMVAGVGVLILWMIMSKAV